MQILDAFSASDLVLLLFVVTAVVSDFRRMKISNRLIFIGILIALGFRISQYGIREAIYVLWNISFPVILLYLFYLLGALGAGDVKLFSLIGSFVNFKELVWTIVFAFGIAALFSLAKMLQTGLLFAGLKDGGGYLLGVLRGNRHPYPRCDLDSHNLIHFSLSMALGLVAAVWYVRFR